MVHRSTLFRRRKKLEESLRVNTNDKSFSKNDEQHHRPNTDPLSSSSLSDLSKNDDENEWFTIDEENIEFNSTNMFKFDEYASNKSKSKPTEKEIATALILLKARHKLSNICINQICYLLRLLKVCNVPKSYSRITRIFHNETLSNNKSTMINVCNECSQTCTNNTHCDNIECGQHESFKCFPLQFLCMPILPQIRDILSRTKILNFKRQDQPMYPIDTMKDISDGEAYNRILLEQSQTRFISLLMNVDGIQIAKSSSTSLWIISLVINELKRNERFKMKNVIVAGVSSSKTKPSRDQMYTILSPIVQELKQLEYGRFFDLTSSNNNLEPLRIFLIGACLDKPAQAIVQNLAEPIGLFGCGRCELAGRTVLIDEKSKHKIRVFPLLPEGRPQPRLRSNFTHDEIINIDENDKPNDKDELRHVMRGHVGACVLRTLKYFDVGHSFLSDSLHNIYHGVMKRLLKLWFDRKHRLQPWSLYKNITQVDEYLSKYKYPSNITRMPRSIIKFHLLKGNELRSILLFGFVAFKSSLSTKYYNHFLLLVVATHLVESRSINREQVELIRIIYERFLRLFPVLYTPRHNVQCVHSLHHFSASVTECGSSSNYSTFNFESFLGILTGSIHATRRHGTEIENNIRLLRAACISLEQTDFNSSIRKFLDDIQSSKRTNVPDSRSETTTTHVRVHNRDTDLIILKQIQQSLNNNKIELFKTCYIDSNRLTISSDHDTSTFTDSCILFIVNTNLRLGFIRRIIRVNCAKQYSCLFQVQLATINTHLHINVNGDHVSCKNVLFGNLDSHSTYMYIKPEQILEKIIHVFDKQSKQFIFFRFPNLVESS